MNKIRSFILCFLIVVLGSITLGNTAYAEGDRQITAISVAGDGYKTVYHCGEALDVNNLNINVVYADGSSDVIPVSTEMVTGFDSSVAKDVLVLMISYQNQTTAYQVKVEKNEGPQAPEGITASGTTYYGAQDGKIYGVSNAMEYSTRSDFSDSKICEGNTVSGLSGGTYYLRYRETSSSFAGSPISIVISEGSPKASNIVISTTNYKTEYTVGDVLDTANLKIRVNYSDGADTEIDVSSSMIRGFDSSFACDSQTLIISYSGCETAYSVKILRKSCDTAPSGLNSVACSVLGAKDGAITGTNSNMEYSSNSDFSSSSVCGGDTTTGLAAGNYYVRYRQTETTLAGPSVTVTVPEGNPEAVSISIVGTGYKTSYYVGDSIDLSGLKLKCVYSDGSSETINVTSSMVSGFDSSAETSNQKITVQYQKLKASYYISFRKKAGPSAPTGLSGIAVTEYNGKDGKITGTSAAMEYAQTSSFVNAKNCTANETTGLEAGTYYVRIRETSNSVAGEYAVVTIGNAAPGVEKIEIVGTDYKTEYTVGDSIDLNGLKIKVYLENGTNSTVSVAKSMITGFKTTEAADSVPVTISYKGQKVQFYITVKEKSAAEEPDSDNNDEQTGSEKDDQEIAQEEISTEESVKKTSPLVIILLLLSLLMLAAVSVLYYRRYLIGTEFDIKMREIIHKFITKD